MPRIFSLSRFFRMVPHSLLRCFFQKLHVGTNETPWRMIESSETKPFFNIFQELPLETQTQIEGIFRDVFELACVSGMEALCQAAETSDETGWFALSSEKTTFYAKSLWTWIHHPEIFQRALEFHKIEQTTWWRKRDGLPRVIPTWNSEVKQLFEQALQTFFMEKQGRGQFCTVEMQNHTENIYHFIAWPDDYVRSVWQHNERGELITRKSRPTFELIFAYDAGEGTLELHAKGGNPTKTALEEIFIEHLIGEEVEVFSEQVYDLSVLKSDDFSLTPHPSDQLAIQLKAVTLLWEGKVAITLQAKRHYPSLSWVRESVSESMFSWDEAIVIYAKFQFLFLPIGKERRRSLTFEIGIPNKCTLRHQDARLITIIRQYLKEWGIEHENAVKEVA